MNDLNNNPNNSGRDDSSLEKLQKDLYSKTYQKKTINRHQLDQKEYSLEGDWEPEKTEKDSKPIDLSEFSENNKKFGFFSYLMIFAALFFVSSVGYAGWVLYGGNQDISANEVDINIVGPVSVGAGEVLSLDVIIQNNNPVDLQAVDLIIDYPDGTRSSENFIDPLKRARDRVEDIPSGTILRDTISSSLFGDEGDNKEISVKVEYQVEGTSAVFSKEKKFSVILNAAPARISVSGLKEVSSGQEVELTATITSNSNTDLKNLMVTSRYPFGFEFIESDVDPTFSNNVWVIENLAPKEKKIIKIKGSIAGQNEEERVFRFSSGLVSDENESEIGVVFNNVIHDLVVKKPFVGLNVVLNGLSDSVLSVNSGSVVRGELVFANNTNDLIRDLDIQLQFEGFVFDELKVESDNGFYRSSDNTLFFNSETSRSLEQLTARSELRTVFKFEVKDLISSGLDVRNPEIKVTASLDAERISENNVEERIQESIVKKVRVISDVFVGAYTFYDMGPFENTGPLPPKAEQETEYTITWSISNNSNNLENARISALLPSYVSWNNKVSPSDEVYSYDENSRRVTWNIGNIPAGTGKTVSAKELSFQIKLFPSLSQLGEVPSLLRDVMFTSTDTFTNTDIDIIGNIPTAKLSDTNAVNNHQTVVE